MDIELIEIRDFLGAHHPFDTLPASELDRLIAATSVRYFRRGSKLPPSGDADESYVYQVRSGAVEVRDAQDHLLGRAAEGELLPVAGPAIAYRFTVLEDALIYQFPREAIDRCAGLSGALRAFLTADAGQRLHQSISDQYKATTQGTALGVSSMLIPVADLIAKIPVMAESSVSIQAAAALMSDKNVSSLLITEQGRLVGIVTDRDLRRRCVAVGTPTTQPVASIMTAKPLTLRSDELLLNALMVMTRRRINHLPVVEGDQIVGMLTAGDLTRHSSNNPVFMMSRIRKAAGLDELKIILKDLGKLQVMLAQTHVTARYTGECVSYITDALTVRLIELAQEELGPAPCPWVWVCGGSQGRQEQTAHSDQDNAIIYDDSADASAQAYFAQLALRVCTGLDACGYVFCPGNAMAMNPQWCKNVSQWRQYFHAWIHLPEPEALLFACIFFDLRPVHGTFTLFDDLQTDVLQQTKASKIFTSHMVSNALKRGPPLGFFRDFVLISDGENADMLDFKLRGIAPIVELARALALAHGVDRVNTTERLLALAQSEGLTKELAENLCAALEFIAQLRIRRQADQIQMGQKPSNFLKPDALSRLDRKQLKDAFLIVKEAQSLTSHAYPAAG